MTGSIPRKKGDRRFTCFGNVNEYYAQQEKSFEQSDAEEASEDDKPQRNNGLSMDTNMPKTLKQASIKHYWFRI